MAPDHRHRNSFLLVLGQPDLGTAGLVLMIGCFQMAFVRINWTSIAIVAFSGLSASIIAWNFVLYEYQKLRVLNFLNQCATRRAPVITLSRA